MLRWTTLLLTLLILGFATVSTSWAQESQDDRLKRLYNDYRCPTCQGLSVKDSEASFSVQIRNKIKELVETGYTDQEISAYFVERYGVWILRSPPKEGFNLVLWALPGVAILIGLFFLYRLSRKWTKKMQEENSMEEQPLSEEEQKLLRRDMNRFENN